MGLVQKILKRDEDEIAAKSAEIADLRAKLATAQSNTLDADDLAELDAAAQRQAAEDAAVPAPPPTPAP